MNKFIVLAEKPSVGRDIARVLNCHKKSNGYIEGSQYIVTWALGHLVTLATPEKYGDQYKTWRIEDLPIIPKQLKLEIIKKTSKQFHIVKSLMNRKDVSEIIIATDAGREGELVARWIIEKSYIKKPIKRLWISSVTDKAIKDGFKKLKTGKAYENLYAAAVGRAEADWLVGLNASRALTCKFNAQLSCGRVQTPTLAIIARREEERKSFKPKTYYGLTANTDTFKLTWQDANNNTRIFDKEAADKIYKSLNNEDAYVTEVNKKLKKSYSPKLYDLTELQRDANKLFNYSAKETLSIMQRLYESHKVLTYPRTDSRYITTDIVDTLKDRIEACKIKPYAKIANGLLKKDIKGNQSFVNNSKVSDHHAIIPTEVPAILSSLSDKERKIYDLVIRRFLAVLSPPYEYKEITIKCSVGKEIFIAKGSVTITDGWKAVYDDSNLKSDNEVHQTLPDINQGDTLKIISLTQTKGETKPPSRFTEATLLSAMENPKKYMETLDQKLIKAIDETRGLGTVATRADIIEKLLNSFLIEKQGKELYITSKGKQLLELVPSEIKSPILTAQWEQKLSNIASGNLDKAQFINEMKNYTKSIITLIKNSDHTFKHNNVTGNRCPECGKFLLEVNGTKGKMLVCQDRSCGYRKGIAKVTNARCPECHKKLSLHGEGDGQIFICKCGYREKLSAFNEKRKKRNNVSSKRDVAKYMKNQNKNKDENINSAFAKALEKFKLE